MADLISISVSFGFKTDVKMADGKVPFKLMFLTSVFEGKYTMIVPKFSKFFFKNPHYQK